VWSVRTGLALAKLSALSGVPLDWLRAALERIADKNDGLQAAHDSTAPKGKSGRGQSIRDLARRITSNTTTEAA